MPFARWENFEACETEMMSMHHDRDSAKKICGAIQARAEKGLLLKAADPVGLDVICKSDGELVIGGYSTYELLDPQNDIITTQAQVAFLKRLFELPEAYRNIMVQHGNYKIGTPILNYTNPEGREYFSHVNEKGTYLITKLRNDNFKTTQAWREKILKGELSMYSIAGLPLEWRMEKGEGDAAIRRITDIEPWEVTLCSKGVNPMTQTFVLSTAQKAEQPVPNIDPRKAEDSDESDEARFELEAILQKHGFSKSHKEK